MILSRKAVAQFLDRDLDDFRWMKKLLRDQILRELDKLKVKPVFRTEPWLHQLVCFYIGICQPRFLFLLDMGLGKSKILSDLITQIQRERKLEGALITVPRLSNIDSWLDDLAVHSQLEPWPVNVSDSEEKWERLGYPKGDVTLIDNMGLHLALCSKKVVKGKNKMVRDDKKIKHLARAYNFLGIDESHKLSNHNNLWFGIFRQLSSRMEYTYATTGTLFGKNPEAMWAQFFLVDGGGTLGENLGLFRASFFTQTKNPWKGTTYTYNEQMDQKLNQVIQHRSLRYDEDEVTDLPTLVPRIKYVSMTEEQREHYLRAVGNQIEANDGIQTNDAPWIRMRQIASGYLAWNDNYGKHFLPFKQNPKMEALEQLIDEMGDSKVVVCYDYTETGRLITERLKEMGLGFEWFYGGTKDKSASRNRFLTKPDCRVMVMNSEAGGTGNDGLQKVARYMIFYESPTPPITRKQTSKRLHRPGQLSRTFIYDLVMKRSLDAGILEDIKNGIDSHDRVVNGQIKKNFLLGV